MNAWFLSRLDHTLDKYLCTRQIVIYGHGKNFEEYNRHLEYKYSGQYAFSVDIDNKKVDGVTIKNVEELKNHVADYYVVVSVGVLDYSILNLLEQFGYQQNKDFFYAASPATINLSCQDFYQDEFGNRIFGNVGSTEIFFYGENATVRIQDGFKPYRLKLSLYSNAKLEISENVKVNYNRLEGDTIWRLFPGAQVSIDKQTVIQGRGHLTCGRDAVITIGQKVSIQDGYHFHSGPYSKICMGDECMLSYDVAIWGNDVHPIYDVTTGQCVNDFNGENVVNIGNHVWLGYRCCLIKKTDIGDGSVVGAQSLVNRKFPNNVIIAGNPARVIRKNIGWKIHQHMEPEYFEMTEEVDARNN